MTKDYKYKGKLHPKQFQLMMTNTGQRILTEHVQLGGAFLFTTLEYSSDDVQKRIENVITKRLGPDKEV